ncbi:AAA family ATPase [Blastococcus goldschmidtiae]|uniref:AAA family ATPase n=1 Tax=Blastococcus goldschmidtiae TaxID=3075546 RepID=A0ABU2KD83_9ACTN|nr:AAA family ATPase [Blastococcus sp. DSM 46792]MDT0278153.1 AAA family ATPase [Blastococcus sp. DSM 46792]
MLIVVSGLPGTGKTAVAAALAGRLAATHLSVDPVEDALLGAGILRSRATGVAAYEVVRVAAEQNLRLGATVVVDAVNDSEPARETWRAAVEGTGAELVSVLLVLDDAGEHRRRLEGRGRPLGHLPEPSWEDVLARAAAYVPWPEGTCLRIGAQGSVDDVVAELLERLPGR